MVARTVLTLLALVSTAQAGDRPEVQRVMFTADGTHALIVTGGVQDGSGFSDAALTVLDTGTGRTLLEARTRSETLPVSAVVQALLTREQARLARLRITPRPAARAVYARSWTTLSPAWSEGLGAGQAATFPVRLWTRPVAVRLEVRPLPSSCRWRDTLPPRAQPAGFTLKVGRQVVHLDRTLPPARACAARYALDHVYVQGNRAVFLLRAYSPGFEGPNAEVVAVAATLK
ncbi:DUF2259 domain-containing protein [Deinococcus hopiensis]|uniref:Predicted secreted protein n=1 Tax=Deinococcus hopiensis KR-140 TaxID=695939 RepID=A0A1W1VEF6_9DEIO|nr:DUF2259 domain-containing protein [Deinococcus hopiensis]SMB91748.1 Predicted secreted protein [Deinococcus hopiensis KR-140]